MAKRGFFAELNYQTQQAEKQRRQEQAAAEKGAAEKEAARLHVESRLAEVESLNASLATTLEEIDGLLAATLDVDDFVDLESLKVRTVEHSPFEPGDLATPVAPPMPELVYPPEPVYEEPPAPTGLSSVFGGKKKHQDAVERSRAEHDYARQRWHEQCQTMHTDYLTEQEKRRQAEADRVEKLKQAEGVYQEQCRRREAEAEARNQEVNKLINDLAFDVPDAIQEYVGIVLSNSVYPDAFPVSHDHKFDLGTRELTLAVSVPEPTTVPAVKEYRYVKAKDEITTTALPIKAQKDRYANAVWQVAVRTLHEVFEADRARKIQSVALTVGVERTAPATGRPEAVPLVAVAADRKTFEEFDLANVVPPATLTHLGAAVSKSPFDLAPADTSLGVRVRGQV